MDNDEPLIEEGKEVEDGRVSEKVATPKTEVKRRSAKKKSRKRTAVKKEVSESDLMVASSEPSPPPKASKGTTTVTSLWPGIVKVSNTPSGAAYGWPQAGARTEVANEDVAFVMSRNRNADRGCCGSNVRIYFSLGN